MRASIFLVSSALVFASAALAQGTPPPANAAPTLTEQEPARAPGAKGDTGKVLRGAGDNSGTTTFYAPTTEAEPARWPCAQPRVSTISAGTIWSGPNLDEGKDWDEDNDLAGLAQKLASRRTSLDDANDLIAGFATKAGADKDKQLTKLFLGVLDITNESRGAILEGIMRYARGQQRLAERMRDESDKIGEAQENATASDIGVATDQQNKDFAWDQRIFTERKQALSYVCEAPSLLERRAYEIAKRIQAQL